MLRFCDADGRINWTPLSGHTGDWLRLATEKRTYCNFRALRMVVLLNPITYLAIAGLIATAGELPTAATYRRMVVALCLFFLMPPLASILDRFLGRRQTEGVAATEMG
jgi:hypothetical protein